MIDAPVQSEVADSFTHAHREQRHPLFERRKHDLVYKTSISQRAAKKGVTLQVPTLEGEHVEIVLLPDELTKGTTEIVRVIQGEGMPIKGESRRGDLRVVIKIRQAPIALWPVNWLVR